MTLISQRNIKRPKSLRFPSILLTHLVPDGFLNMGQGFSFILGHRQQSLNYLSALSAVSGGTVDLVKQLKCGSQYMQIGRLSSQSIWQGYTNKIKGPFQPKMVAYGKGILP